MTNRINTGLAKWRYANGFFATNDLLQIKGHFYNETVEPALLEQNVGRKKCQVA